MPEEKMAESVEETQLADDSSASGSPTDQEETPTQESESETSADQVTEERSESQTKPTRSERRIEQLLSKLKDKPQADSIIDQPPPILSENDVDGVDPIEYQQRLNQTLQFNNDQVRRQIKAELAYEQSVKQHEADLDKVAQEIKDPAVERMFVREYERANYQFNPLTGQMMFVPTVSPGEVLNQILKDLEAVVSSRVAEAGVDLTKQAQTGAVQPSQTGSDRLSLSDLKKNIWKDPEGVAKALGSRLTYAED